MAIVNINTADYIQGDGVTIDENVISIEVGVGGHVIQYEGVSVPQKTNLNFTGAGVEIDNDNVNDSTNVYIPGFCRHFLLMGA